MAFKEHVIERYEYSFDARTGGPGRLRLWGQQGKLAEVMFVADTAPVPPPILMPDLNSAIVSFKQSMVPLLIDMLRNEKPVSVKIDNQAPGGVFIHTGLEPVGEGEG